LVSRRIAKSTGKRVRHDVPADPATARPPLPHSLTTHWKLYSFLEYSRPAKSYTFDFSDRGQWFESIYQITIDKHYFLKAIMSPKLVIDILGWTGSVFYLLAYAMVSLKKTEGDSVLYQGMNIFAGVLLVVYTLSLGAFATTGLNAVWVAIGVFTIGRKWLTRN
jgi:hypothetical protein